MADIDPAATLRRAAELAPTVLPAEIGALVAQKITLALDSPMRVANLHPHYARLAAEVLALAEQHQARDDPAERGWEFRLSPDRRHIAIWDPGNEPWFVPARSMDGWWRRDHEVEDWQRFVAAPKGGQS